MIGMPFYRLTHLDQHQLPTHVVFEGAEWLVTDGRVQIHPPDELAAVMGDDGSVYWELIGTRQESAAPSPIYMARHRYRRRGTAEIEFPVERADVPIEFIAEVSADAVKLRFKPLADRESGSRRFFGQARTWHFRSAPDEDRPAKWRADAPPVHLGIAVEINERERPWLSRIISFVVVPFLNWRDRRRFEHKHLR